MMAHNSSYARIMQALGFIICIFHGSANGGSCLNTEMARNSKKLLCSMIHDKAVAHLSEAIR